MASPHVRVLGIVAIVSYVRINQRVAIDEEPIEFVCNENQQFRRRIKID